MGGASTRHAFGGRGPKRVKMRRTRIEHMSAGLPLITDIALRGWHGRKVPTAVIAAVRRTVLWNVGPDLSTAGHCAFARKPESLESVLIVRAAQSNLIQRDCYVAEESDAATFGIRCERRYSPEMSDFIFSRDNGSLLGVAPFAKNGDVRAHSLFALAQPVDSLKFLLWEPPNPSVSQQSASPQPHVVAPAAGHQSAELDRRIDLWKKSALLCNHQGRQAEASQAAFPTKEPGEQENRKDPQGRTVCNDGDMVLFNGLLCAAGEEQGCVGVRDSRERNGRWWRSPAIKLRGVDHVKEPNLNADQVLGVLLYALQKNDSEAFHRWLNWVKSIGPCTADECLASGANLPRFCSLQGKESLICAAKPVTCPLIQVVGDLLGEATAAHAVCGDPHVLGTGTGLLSVGLLLKGLPPLPPMPDPVALGHRFKELLSESDGVTKRYEDLRQKVEDLRKKLGWDVIPFNPLPKTDTLKKQIEIEIEKLELAVREIRDLARLRGLGGLALAYSGRSDCGGKCGDQRTGFLETPRCRRTFSFAKAWDSKPNRKERSKDTSRKAGKGEQARESFF
jgi:hypothetical protein